MDFRYFMPTDVRFGCGSLKELEGVVEQFNPGKILVCLGGDSMRRTGVLDRVKAILGECEVVLFDDIEPDPLTKSVDDGVKKASGCGLVVGLGGGSVLD
ncbi:MAG: iron-containing alcohol dehydrogenase, partial [Candidatus Altiarchaeota archaeon]|nr:iron-containing alcohol dehydrogenase [Candidatus Altiarchaeota archaeon]